MSDIKLGTDVLKRLTDDKPERHDVFLGLVAPIGSSRERIIDALTSSLDVYGYAVERIRLTDLLDSVRPAGSSKLPTRGQARYYTERMNAGDRLRRLAGNDSALAALAVARVAKKRLERRARTDPPTLYIFDSLKHPKEAALLRSVYSAAFWLVSIVEDSQSRLENVSQELARQEGRFGGAPGAQATELIDRDEADPDATHGQQVRDIFAIADFFLPFQTGGQWKKSVDRLLQGMFGAPFLTPSVDEEAMRHAQAAALRSAAIGRQVGAAVIPPLGAPHLLGTNEVPKPGGGQFREGDEPDHRDFQSGSDPTPAYTERVIRELMDRLAKAGYFTPDRNTAGGAAVLKEATTPDATGRSVLDGARAKSLIEFTRCLHAEQAAIVDAARSGVAISQGRLYTTTFPCHECTKFIIGAGIVEVQYIEPYPKSLAGDLFGDLIDAVSPLPRGKDGTDSSVSKVPFRPFVGFGPSRYDEVFAAKSRREGSGVAEHVMATASPIGDRWSEIATRERENEVALAISSVAQRVRSSETANEPDQSLGAEDSDTKAGGSEDVGAQA